jgi:lactate dehydrogenase-like 2-hydroxyacid dehydrogenase
MPNSPSKINIVGEFESLLVKSDNVTLHCPITRVQYNLSICLTHLMK